MQAGSSVAPVAARLALPLPTHWLFMHALRAAAGVAAGACCAVGLWTFWSQWGTSLATNCGLTLAAATALIAGLRLVQWKPFTARHASLTWLGLGIAVAAGPWRCHGRPRAKGKSP